jgi:hypothetical protein
MRIPRRKNKRAYDDGVMAVLDEFAGVDIIEDDQVLESASGLGVAETHPLYEAYLEASLDIDDPCADCGHSIEDHQTGDGPWTGFCGIPDCECEAPTPDEPLHHHGDNPCWTNHGLGTEETNA